MTLGELLEKSSNSVTAITYPETIASLNVVNSLTSSDTPLTTTTGAQWLAAIDTLDTTTQSALLKFELSSGSDQWGVLRQLVQHVQSGQGRWKTGVAVFMAILIGVAILNHCYLLYYAVTHSLPLPRWQDSTWVIVVPAGILWTWYGVLSKENRDLMSTFLGELPARGPLGALAALMAPKTPPVQPAVQQSTDVATVPQNPTQSDSDVSTPTQK